AAVAAQAAAARRALDGSGPAGGGEDLRGRAVGGARGRDDPARRTERQPRARVRRAWLRDGVGQGDPHRQRRGPARRPRRTRRLSRRGGLSPASWSIGNSEYNPAPKETSR